MNARSLAWLFVLAAAPALAGGDRVCATAPSKPDAALAARLDPIVESAVADGFAGGVALMRGGELVYERVAGHSDAAGRVPVTSETLFHVASITKYVTAALTLRAAEEGKLELSEPVAPHVPGTGLARRGVTFMDLLTHQSGLGSSYAAEGESDPARALVAIDTQAVDAESVGRFRYSNDGYDLLAILLERIYGSSYEQLARTRLFAPACLEAPKFWAEVDLTDASLVGQPLRKVGKRLRKRNYGMLGSAGLLVRAVDLALLQHALMSGSLLTPESRALLLEARDSVSIGSSALGAFVLEHPDLGRVISARGYQDWGDNAILNHYLEPDVILGVVTSKGPAEKTGKAPFRTSIGQAIEAVLSTKEGAEE